MNAGAEAEEQALRSRRVAAPVIARVAAVALVLGAALRLYILFSSPLSPARPILWLLAGTLEDVAVLGLVGCVLAVAARFVPGPLVVALFALLAAAHSVAHLAWAEVVVYFGHPPRREDLRVGVDAPFLRNSLDAATAIRVSALVVLAAAAWWVLRRFRPARPERLLLVSGAAALLLSLPRWPIHLRETARTPLLALVDLARSERTQTAGKGLRVPPPRRAPVEIRSLVPEKLRPLYEDDDFPLAHSAPVRAPGAAVLPPGAPERPNVVFLVMEGVRANEIGCYGGPVPGLTPNLDALAREGVRVAHAHAAGTNTPTGELALWYGLLPLLHELVMTDLPETPLRGLPEILRGAGWRSFVWIHGGDQTFYERQRFYLPRGIRTIDGRDFAAGDTRTNWGMSDRVLARRAVDVLDRLQEPFAGMVLTVSNHHPFQVPADARTSVTIDQPEQRGFRSFKGLFGAVGLHTVPMLRTIHYTDEAIGSFIERARRRAWFARTIFVISGDHGLPIVPLDGLPTMHLYAELRHGVPLILYAPALLPHGLVVPGPGSLADVPATLLGFLGLDVPSVGPGIDLLDPGAQDGERPVVSWDEEGRTVTISTARFTYHGRLPDGVDWNPPALVDELLVDTDADPRGLHDVSAREPRVLATLREKALTFLDTYSWIVASGHARVPPPGR